MENPEAETIDDLQILSDVLSLLKKLNVESQQRVLSSVITFLDLDIGPKSAAHPLRAPLPAPGEGTASQGFFSQDRSMSPKDFLNDKHPQTDVERVACLGYYLTYFRNMPHFQTIDISRLNTEAAQIKFSNAAYAINNAVQSGYLAPAPDGKKQLSAAGERFVQALPDRDAARTAISNARRRRTSKRTARSGSVS